MFKEPHHIIAIGASAGSMEEINSFFDRTPIDGVSYVIIQHLSPDFKSRMIELLSKHSKLKVILAENNMPVNCNQVYLIPNTKFMTIVDGKLRLTEKEKVPGPHLTINKFFTSLAADKGNKSIAIILSGLGTDGTEGIRAIKQAGGMIIARDPETAEFSSMPASAIATGLVDFILEPELMPGKIEDYVNNADQLTINNKDDEDNIIAIIDLIKQQLPLDFTDYKQTTILRRIKRRAAYNDFTNLSNYFHFLKGNTAEIEMLARDFLISVTSFFRDPDAFFFLEKEVLPSLLNKLPAGEELKIWVTGCATGEEAYSLAILIHELLIKKNKNTVVKIFATDIDTSALLHAGKALYSKEIIKHVSTQRLAKYFIGEGEQYKISTVIRKMVIFAQHDLIKNPPYCNMNFISCRNLLIYMNTSLQNKIFLMLLFGLKTDGYLFLGSSENPVPIIHNLAVISKKWKIYRSIEIKKFVRFDAFSLPVLLNKKLASEQYPIESSVPDNLNNMTDAVNNTLIAESEKLLICIDENKNVVKYYGDPTRFLLQKNFNLHLSSLLPAPLGLAFNALSNESLKTNKRVTVKGISIADGQASINVSLSVSPLLSKKQGPKMQMITICEEKSFTGIIDNSTIFNEKIFLDKYILDLEQELEELKEKLQTSYLQLDASNESMQSFNEELLSANEEMQSTNEEMQSVNEELHSINADYHLKNKELSELNDDLNNYFRSNINGQLFVNNDLLLMKFSPGTVKQINLLPSDVGRPLSNISTNIKFETIIKDIQTVLVEGSVITKEIETSNGKWYQIMTMPYIQTDNKINGAIITFNDITELKQTQEELKSLVRINTDLNNFVYTASHDLLAPLGNIELSIGVMNEVKVVDPELNKFLSIINTSVKKFRTLINDLSVIAKIESEMMSMELVDVEEIIKNIEWSLDDKIKKTGTRILYNLEVKQLTFSKKNFRSILFNLISNSIKFRGSLPPEITISTKKDGNNIIFIIKDNGIGISNADKERIFQLYGRLHLDVEGHGIGLYLAKKIVDAANGNIVVESELGKGTTFSIILKTQQPILSNKSFVS